MSSTTVKSTGKSKKILEEARSVPVSAMLGGLGIGFIITCIVFIGYALLLTYTNITEKNASIVVLLTVVVSVIVAGFDTSKAAKNKGWMWGMACGLIYAIILFAVGSFVTRQLVFSTSTITMLLVALASGGLGGIIGINVKRK